MKYYFSRFKHAKIILSTYNYPNPFQLHIKHYLRANKQFGSKDRKAITEICYAYLRMRRSLSEYKLEQAILISSFCWFELEEEVFTSLTKELGVSLKWPKDFGKMGDKERISYVEEHLTIGDEALFNKKFVNAKFAANQMHWIRYRPLFWLRDLGGAKEYLRSLGFQESLELDKAYSGQVQQIAEREDLQVQDYSSQWMLSKIDIGEGNKVWDCCCGSGGKSIPLLNSKNEFYLSDQRDKIIGNAKRRLKQHKRYIADIGVHDLIKDTELQLENSSIPAGPFFDVIIADVPCSGSGTWFRNPEHFSYFDYSQIAKYVKRQKQILKSVIPRLKDGGFVYYLTCSIFTQENQDIVEYAEKELGLKTKEIIDVNGFQHDSDSMFMAVLTKA
ncbi:MAG: hypothetical protein JXR19_02775 [Bacteroidia bacterium]